MNLINYSSTAWSILPPILALVLAVFTRRVILSLSVGIIVGAIMLTDANILQSIEYLFHDIANLGYNMDEHTFNWNNIDIILFLLLLGVLTALLSVSGSNQAFAIWAQKHIKNRRGAKLMAASLVFVTFIDDYFHSLAVGAIARPVTDKFRVSRAKLAYILDSTAAPMCVLMPISSWGAYIITLISGLLGTYAITSYSPMGAFMVMSSMNYYAIFSILMVFFVSYFAFDIGPMAKSEKLAQEYPREDDVITNVNGHVRNLILPILTLIIVTVFSMIYTGFQVLSDNHQAFSILGAFENTTVGISLVVGGLSSILVATICIMLDRKITRLDYAKAWVIGIRSMLGAVIILCFAWTINNVVADMQTGKYLSSLISGNLPIATLPALLFLLSAIMAFSTGTSWGTFGIMLPIAAAIAASASPDLMLPCLSAVMAGAVCGDHCSPISDTTILSSTGARCDHMEHVTTQLPYAMTIALASIVGYLVVGYTLSAFLGFIATAITLTITILIIKKR